MAGSVGSANRGALGRGGGRAGRWEARGETARRRAVPVTDFYTGFKPRQGRPPTLARQPFDRPPRLDKYLADGQAAVREPFVGITTDGTIVPGLFGREKTGVSTRPIQAAAEAFLAALDPMRRA